MATNVRLKGAYTSGSAPQREYLSKRSGKVPVLTDDDKACIEKEIGRSLDCFDPNKELQDPPARYPTEAERAIKYKKPSTYVPRRRR